MKEKPPREGPMTGRQPAEADAYEGATMGWHVSGEQLTAYVCGRLGDADAWSVETHVASCPGCATRVGEAVQQRDLAVRVDDVRGVVMAQVRSEASQRARVGTRPASSWTRAWRLMTAAPALRLPWITAAVVTIACAALLSLVSYPGGTHPVLLLVAPLLPVAGVAATYGPGMDPAHELTLATPFSGFRLLLLRTVTVLGVTVPLLLVASFAIPTAGVNAAAWLLPALALVLAALVLGSWVEQRVAAGIAGGGWIAAVLIPHALAVVEAPPVFAASAQWGWAGAAVLAIGLLFLRRGAYDRMEA
ncbi:MAG: anti-sigma factor family protein [Streptosporangiaceae bacterium]